MRPLLHGDVSAAARVLYTLEGEIRELACIEMIDQAEVADEFRERTGRVHPVFGNGSLMSVARKRRLADEPNFGDVEYCRCYEVVLRCLIDARINHSHS